MAGEIYFNNITGRFDWGSIIDQIIKLKSMPIQRLSQEAQQVKAKQDALSKLQQAVQDFSSLFNSLDVESLFKSKKATSSDSSVLTATANEQAPDIALNITINSLAQKEVLITVQGVSDLNQLLNWGDFQIAYNTGAGIEQFNVSAGGGTLQDLVNAINNSAGSRITASIFYDGTSYKLMLSEKDEGASTVETASGSTVMSINGLTVNGSPWSLDTTNPLQNASNARVQIGSNVLTSPTNTFENLITGLNITVNKTGNAVVSVSDDYSKVSNFFEDFVKKYNAVISQVNQLTAKDALFQGDYTVVGIKTELSRMLDDLFANDLVNVKEDGTLETNPSAISAMASSNPEELKGIIQSLKDTVGAYLSNTSVSLQNFTSDYQSRLDQLNSRAQYLSEQLVNEEERLRLEYAKVEAFMNQAQDVMARLQAFVVSLSDMQGGKK